MAVNVDCRWFTLYPGILGMSHITVPDNGQIKKSASVIRRKKIYSGIKAFFSTLIKANAYSKEL